MRRQLKVHHRPANPTDVKEKALIDILQAGVFVEAIFRQAIRCGLIAKARIIGPVDVAVALKRWS